jgi:NAD(P)-dependent dehydrogenase (short-subunit alcohol dehydrogenase family)
MAATLARHGASVAIADVDGDRAHERATALAREGLDALAVTMDIATDASVADGFAAVTARFGGIDILVNNAMPAATQDGPVCDLSLAAWGALLDGGLGGALLCSRHAIPIMAARGGGSIVNVASIHAHAGDLNLTAYAVTKAALLGLTRATATQYGRAGVRANSVSLGTVPTATTSEEFRQSRLRHQLLARSGRPADAANVVAYLASPAASFVTGADFVVDGGVLAHLPSYADPSARIVLGNAAGRGDGAAPDPSAAVPGPPSGL